MPARQPNCTQCKFFDSGACHRWPPAVTVVPMPRQHAISQRVEVVPQAIGAFPPVGEDHWCGEWTANINLQ
jgi:hypothetical protein